MYIAVTGASGMLGRHAVADLLAAGHQVRALDRSMPRTWSTEFRRAEMRDLGQVCGALHGCEAVLHLAAIPTLTGHSYDEVFTTNVISTYNVLEAAALLGIKRIVTISSCSALGVAYRFHHVALQYLPVDEAHPLLPQEAYGLSKQVGEQICSAFHRRTGGAALSMRFPFIWDSQQAPDVLAHLSNDEHAAVNTLFSYIDARDAARACRLALETPGLTDEAFYVMAPETFMKEPSAALARRHFPEAEIRGDEQGHWAFHNCSRAEQLLGFSAEHRWRPDHE